MDPSSSKMPDWNGEMLDDTNISRASGNTATFPQHPVAGPSSQWSVDVPMESEAMMEPPGVSTGARKRDPQPSTSRACSSSSHDRHTFKRNRHSEITGTKIAGNIWTANSFAGVLMGKKKGNRLSEPESEVGVTIPVGDTDGFNSDLNAYGTTEGMALAREIASNLIPRAENHSRELQELIAIFQNEPTFNYKTFCEIFKLYRKEQIANLPPAVKDFYHEDPLTAAMSSEAANNWRKDHYNMQVRRNSFAGNLRPIPNPALSLEHLFGFQTQVLSMLYNQGITRPYPVQSQALPILLRGDDFICVAPSGTGKTLAVLLTALIHADGQPSMNRNGPSALILAPSREMVNEMQNDLSNYGFLGINYVCLSRDGYQNIQLNLLSGPVDIVIATPIRLYELAMARYIQLELFSFVALMEIDSMIKIIPEAVIKNIIFNTRPDKQVVMTCAKWDTRVRIMALLFMTDPIQLKLGIVHDAESVTQRVQFVEKKEKENVIIQYLTNITPDAKVVVYCQNPDTATNIGIQLTLRDINCRFIYGHLAPSEREVALNDVFTGSVNILLASDMACRYVNLFNLTHVINFEYPGRLEYIDRLNRIGRAGIVLTCITEDDSAFARDLVMILKEARQEVPDELEKMAQGLEALSIRGATPGGPNQQQPE